MLNRVLCVVTTCSFAAVIAVADHKSPEDAKSLQGTWHAVYLEANGEKSPVDQVKELQIVIKDDEIFTVKPEGESQKCKFKLDSSRTPQTIDLSPVDGPDKGKTAAGIYSLKNGQLKLCVNLFGKDTTQRPAEFKTHAGDGVGFAILKRVADDRSANDFKALQGVWQAVDLEANGKKSPDDQVKEWQIVIKADEAVLVKSGSEDPKNKFKINTSKTPKVIDVTPLSGPSKGKTFAGIYSLKKGRLTLCVNIFGNDTTQRPTEFKTRPRDGAVLLTLERADDKNRNG